MGRITPCNMAKLIIYLVGWSPECQQDERKVHKHSSLTPALQLFALANRRNLRSEQIAAGRATRAAMTSSLAHADHAGTAWF